MQLNRKAFTIVELLVGIVIVNMIAGAALYMMTRGASNVKKGNFNAIAANQAAWIIASLKEDISRAYNKKLLEDDNQKDDLKKSSTSDYNQKIYDSFVEIISSKGVGTLHLPEGHVEYNRIILGDKINYRRIYKNTIDSKLSLTQNFGGGYLTDIKIEADKLEDANAGGNSGNSNKTANKVVGIIYKVTLNFEEKEKSVPGNNKLEWKANIYKELPPRKDLLWHSTTATNNNNP